MSDNAVSAVRLDTRLTIFIIGRFSFELVKKFRVVFEKEEGIYEYIIDMKQVSFIDSSALGSLMLLRNKAAENEALIILCTAS